jgi:hypothetical protein
MYPGWEVHKQPPPEEPRAPAGEPSAADPDLILGKNVGHFLVQLDDGTVHRGGSHSFRRYLAAKRLREEEERAGRAAETESMLRQAEAEMAARRRAREADNKSEL